MTALWRQQDGYVLPVTLFFLAASLLWGSILLLTLSDRYAASNGVIQQEQSRLLACSGWNLALQQLETSGSLEPLEISHQAGQAQVTLQALPAQRVAVQVRAQAGAARKNVQGVVRLWPAVVEEVNDNLEADDSVGYRLEVLERKL